MEQPAILKMQEEYSEYLHDESRTVGTADSISFPKTEAEVIAVIKQNNHSRITVQGARTGISGAAVPNGGHILNLSRMDAVLGCRKDENGTFYFRVQPGVILSELRKAIETKKFQTDAWDDASKEAYAEFCRAGAQFFAPDPTETSATIGGMVSCNASGARSYHYGPTRRHVNAIRVALANGDLVALHRGQQMADGRKLQLTTESGTVMEIQLPGFTMPKVKNASGYYVEDGMDAIDLFIGSDGTLGVITEIEVALMPLPAVIWGVTSLFRQEIGSLQYVELLQKNTDKLASIEFFDGDALAILRKQRESSAVFASLPAISEEMNAAVYTEIHADTEEEALAALLNVGAMLTESGGEEADTWVARNQSDLDQLLFFRHAVPESVNMLIDRRRQVYPTISKLGTDMSVPNGQLKHMVEVYREGLSRMNLESAVWGHIGDNHLHVNILPRDPEDYARGKQLHMEWAQETTRLGGAVSAEHGVGKLKRNLLTVMYGEDNIDQMRALKKNFDPNGIFGNGNLFSFEKEA